MSLPKAEASALRVSEIKCSVMFCRMGWLRHASLLPKATALKSYFRVVCNLAKDTAS